MSCLGLCRHPTPPEIAQLQGAHSELLWKEALLHCLSCFGLCWHPTQPEIGRLQGALCELLCIEVLIQCLSCLGLCWHQLQAVKVHTWDFHCGLPHTGAWSDLHLENSDFVACSTAAQAVRHYFPHMPRWCADFASCEEAETPGSQAGQLVGSRFDCHLVGNCLGGAVVGIVGGQSFPPSAVLMPLLRHLQFPHLQTQQLIHQSLRKALPAWDNYQKSLEVRNKSEYHMWFVETSRTKSGAWE